MRFKTRNLPYSNTLPPIRKMTTNEWKYCQNNSDLILISGLIELTKSKRNNFGSDFENGYGNYLISDKKDLWNYTGEAKSLLNRLKQHSKEKTSTFYNNYSKKKKKRVLS